MLPDMIQGVSKSQLDQEDVFLAPKIQHALSTNGLLLIQDVLPTGLSMGCWQKDAACSPCHRT
jgi:hypothetical protein